MQKAILYAIAVVVSLIFLGSLAFLAIVPLAFLILLFSTHKPIRRQQNKPINQNTKRRTKSNPRRQK